MKKLLKACTAVAIAAALVAGGVWAALSAPSITAGDHVVFQIDANVRINASAVLGINETAFSTYNYDSELTSQDLVWNISTSDTPTRLTKTNYFITYTFVFENTGDTDIKVEFTEAKSSDETNYEFNGGDTEGGLLVVEIAEGDSATFEFRLELTNKDDLSDTVVSFDCSVTQVREN